MRPKFKQSLSILVLVYLVIIAMIGLQLAAKEQAQQSAAISTSTPTPPPQDEIANEQTDPTPQVNGVATPVMQTVNPSAINDYLANPGIGWQYMASSNTNLLPETVAYFERADVSWRLINPAEGSYNWSLIDNRIQTAVNQGKMASFRIYTMRGESYGGHQIPDWVMNKGIRMLGSEPDYSGCVYQEYWGNFVNVLRQRYDGNPNIAYIDISGYGDFNEWSWRTQTEWDNNALSPNTVDGMARKRLADMFIGGSSSSHSCRNGDGSVSSGNSYSYAGWNSTQLIMPFAGVRQSISYVANRRSDVGFRHDCLGRAGSAVSDFSNQTGIWDQRWKTAPMVYELCAINWNDSNFVNRADGLLKWSHGSLVHDNPNGGAQPQATMQNLMRNVGYRYQLSQAVIPATATQGSQVQVTMNWLNVGYAPNYPKMGQNFELQMYLLRDGQERHMWPITSTNIASWFPANTLPGTPPTNSVSANITLPNISAGDYSVAVNIIDKRTGNPINLAISGKQNFLSGAGVSRHYYVIGSMSLQQNTPTPPAPPAPTPTPTPTPNPTPTPSPNPTPEPTPTPDPVPQTGQGTNPPVLVLPLPVPAAPDTQPSPEATPRRTLRIRLPRDLYSFQNRLMFTLLGAAFQNSIR